MESFSEYTPATAGKTFFTDPLNDDRSTPKHAALALMMDAARRDPKAALELYLDASYAAFYYRNGGDKQLRGQSYGEQVLQSLGIELKVDNEGFTINKGGGEVRYYDDPYRSNQAYYLQHLVAASRYRVFPTFDEIPVVFATSDHVLDGYITEKRNYEACMHVQAKLVELRNKGNYGRGPEEIYDAVESPTPITETEVSSRSGSKETMLEIERVNTYATGDWSLEEIYKSLVAAPLSKETQVLIDNLPDYNVPVLRSHVISKVLPVRGYEKYETIKDVPSDSRYAVVRKLIRWAHCGVGNRLLLHQRHELLNGPFYRKSGSGRLDYIIHVMRNPDETGHPQMDHEHLVKANHPHEDQTMTPNKSHVRPRYAPVKREHTTQMKIRIRGWREK